MKNKSKPKKIQNGCIKKASNLRLILLICFLTFLTVGCSQKEKTYYAIEISGNLVGYSETTATLDKDSGNPTISAPVFLAFKHNMKSSEVSNSSGNPWIFSKSDLLVIRWPEPM